MADLQGILFQLSVWAIPVLLAITLHEAAHGWVAWKLGDDTAYRLGRVSFNPLRHIDPMGTVLLPAMLLFLSGGRFLFGYAKPVPVNFGRLHHPRRDMVYVAAAGPGINLAIALIAAALFHVLPYVPPAFGQWLGYNLYNGVWINVLLAVFNMMPLPPLDGGRVAVGLLPPRLGARLASLERYGLAIIIGVVFVLPWAGRLIGFDLDLFGWLVIWPASLLSDAIFAIAGVHLG